MGLLFINTLSVQVSLPLPQPWGPWVLACTKEKEIKKVNLSFTEHYSVMLSPIFFWSDSRVRHAGCNLRNCFVHVEFVGPQKSEKHKQTGDTVKYRHTYRNTDMKCFLGQ